jgi:hypothetical protein
MRTFAVCAVWLILLVPGTGRTGAAEEAKSSCLTSDGAVIQMSDTAFMRLNYQSQLAATWRDTGSGADGTGSTTDFYFRRNRLTISGQASGSLSYSIKLDQRGPQRIGPVDVAEEPVSDFDVLEAYVEAELGNDFHVTAGTAKIPFTREVLDGCFNPLTLDRSLFIATPMQRTRDTGLVFWGNAIQSKVKYMAAIQEGQESGSAPESSPRYTGRVHLALLDPENVFGYSGTYLGNKMVFTVGAAAQYEAGAVYDDVSSMTGGKDYQAWTADVFIEYPVGLTGSATLSAAYMETNFDDAYRGADPDPGSVGIDGEKKGWYAKAGFLFLDAVGPGQVQPFVRHEEWDFALLNGVFAQRVTWTGGGVNYLINGQNLRLTLEYAQTDFKDEDNPDSMDFKTITTMLQFGF